jgi:hypothetical protein
MKRKRLVEDSLSICKQNTVNSRSRVTSEPPRPIIEEALLPYIPVKGIVKTVLRLYLPCCEECGLILCEEEMTNKNNIHFGLACSLCRMRCRKVFVVHQERHWCDWRGARNEFDALLLCPNHTKESSPSCIERKESSHSIVQAPKKPWYCIECRVESTDSAYKMVNEYRCRACSKGRNLSS